MPPKLSARTLFWWGVGIWVAAFFANQILTDAVLSPPGDVNSTLVQWLSAVIGALLILGPVLVVGGLIVRALSDDETPRD